MPISFMLVRIRRSKALRAKLATQTIEQVKKIQNKILTTQSRQKSYADKRRKPMQFQEGEHVFLKVTPTMGIGKAIKVGNLSPRFVGPFQILKRIEPVVYQIALHQIYLTFVMSFMCCNSENIILILVIF